MSLGLIKELRMSFVRRLRTLVCLLLSKKFLVLYLSLSVFKKSAVELVSRSSLPY